MHGRLQDLGLSCRSPGVKPLLNKRRRHKRLAWAEDSRAVQSGKVLKVHFAYLLENPGPRVWRKRGEAQNPPCWRSSVKFPQSVMVLGAVSSAGVGPLCFLRSKVNAANYQDVSEHCLLLTNVPEMQISFSSRICTRCQSDQDLV